MSARFKMAAALASLALVLLLLRCLWLWQPERQLLLHQQHFLDAAQDRNWSRVEAALDPAYADRWGHTRASLIAESREWLRQFFALTITAGSVRAQVTPSGGVITERIAFDGTGTPMAQIARDTVNRLQAPCVFEWKHAGWKPWTWTLCRIDNPDLPRDDPWNQ